MKKFFPPVLASLILLSLSTLLVHAQSDPNTIPNPFKGGDTLPTLFQTIIQTIIIPIGGVIAVLAFIWSGFMYVTAQGNPKKIGDANKALLYTAIGTAILLGSWVISQVITSTVNELKP